MAALLLNACGAIEIKDERWYGFISPPPSSVAQPVSWFDTLDNKSGTMAFDAWLAASPTGAWACTDTNTLAEIKSEIEKLCSAYKDCAYEKVAAILGKFLKRVRDLEP